MECYETKDIRNIAVLGHGGAGKTMLCEAMLHTSGATERMGRIESGNTVSDFDLEEIKRHFSIRTSLIPVEWKKCKLNMLDTPGYFDFEGGVCEATSVAEAALIVINAASGVEVGTEKAWKCAEEARLPRIFFVSQMDALEIDFPKLIKACQDKFGVSIAPIQVPWYENGNFVGYIHALKMIGRRFDGKKVVDCEVPEHLKEEVKQIHTLILEAVAEADDELMEKYLQEEEISTEEIEHAYKKGVLEQKIAPVLCGSSIKEIGVSVLMDTIISLFPAPNEVKRADVFLNEEDYNPSEADNAPAIFIFKTLVDPFIGRLSLFKVMHGSVTCDLALTNHQTGELERLSHIYTISGKQQKEVEILHMGDLGALAKLRNTKTGDTLSDKAFLYTYKQLTYPKGFVKKAIFPQGKGDEEKMSQSLYKLMAEDRTFEVEQNRQTHETIISALGEQQIDVIVSMLLSKFKVAVYLQNPTTPYRETIKGSANVRGKYKKQSGGHGQYGDVVMSFEPSQELEIPYVFEEKIFGGSVPKQYFPAVEKGLEESTQKGVLAGYPVVGIKAVLLDGSYHPVDSSEMAFKMATILAFKEGVSKAQPILLEPIAQAEITVPENNTGDIMSDMKKRRGRMLGMSLVGREQVIIVEMPLAELYTYATDIRSMTQGRGYLTYHFVRYEEAPIEIQNKVISQRSHS